MLIVKIQFEGNKLGKIKLTFILICTQRHTVGCPIKQTRIVAKKTAYTHQEITKKSVMILVCLIGQKSGKFMIGILGETMTS